MFPIHVEGASCLNKANKAAGRSIPKADGIQVGPKRKQRPHEGEGPCLSLFFSPNARMAAVSAIGRVGGVTQLTHECQRVENTPRIFKARTANNQPTGHLSDFHIKQSTQTGTFPPALGTLRHGESKGGL
jgi:hypothetical protein